MIVSTKSIAALTLAFMALTASADVPGIIDRLFDPNSGLPDPITASSSSVPAPSTVITSATSVTPSVPALSIVTATASVPALPPSVSDAGIITFYNGTSNCFDKPVTFNPLSSGVITGCSPHNSNCGTLEGAASFVSINDTTGKTTCALFSGPNCTGPSQNAGIFKHHTSGCTKSQQKGLFVSFSCSTGC